MVKNREFRLQSAMEYLMTYGWAILIIAIVLGVLYYLGVFSPTVIGPACVVGAPYYCQSPTMGTNGEVSFTLGQSSSATEYNIALACAAVSNSLGAPSTNGLVSAFYYPGTSNGIVGSTTYPGSSNTLTLVSGQTQQIYNLPCFSTTSTLITSASIGSGFTGKLWLNYTASSGAPNSVTNAWQTAQIGSISVKVT